MRTSSEPLRTSSVAQAASQADYEARDEPPEGVPRQVQAFQGGSPAICHGQTAATLAVGHNSIQEPDPNTKYDPYRPIDGDQVWVCLDPTTAQAEVALRVTHARGELRHTVNPQEGSTWEVPLFALGPGRYNVASNVPSATDVTFTVEPARSPAFRVEAGKQPRVLLVGLQPNQGVRLHVYRNPPSGAAGRLASYRGTQQVMAGRNGRMLVHLDPRAIPSGRCYTVTTQVGGRLLYDANHSLGLLCPPS